MRNLDVLPRSSYSSFDNAVETVVHFHDEPLETIVINRARVVSAFIRRVFERIKVRVNFVEGSAEVTHDRAHAITVNMDHTN